MAYKSGFTAVQESIKEAAAKASARTEYANGIAHPIQKLWNLSWDEGEEKTVRFLTSNIVQAYFHEFIPCPDGKRREFADTSKLEGELRRPDVIAADPRFNNERGYPAKPRETYLAIVVERKKVGGVWEDVTDTFEVLSDPDDPKSELETIVAPRFWVIKQGSRFWDQVNVYWSDYGNITDRNYKIRRTGKGTSTTYMVRDTPEDPEDMYKTEEALASLYQIPVMEGYEDDPVQGWIVEWLERRGTEKYFENLTGKKTPKEEPTVAVRRIGAVSKSEEPSEPAPSDDKVSDMKARLASRYAKK